MQRTIENAAQVVTLKLAQEKTNARQFMTEKRLAQVARPWSQFISEVSPTAKDSMGILNLRCLGRRIGDRNQSAPVVEDRPGAEYLIYNDAGKYCVFKLRGISIFRTRLCFG
jgi:hypothetical protein